MSHVFQRFYVVIFVLFLRFLKTVVLLLERFFCICGAISVQREADGVQRSDRNSQLSVPVRATVKLHVGDRDYGR